MNKATKRKILDGLYNAVGPPVIAGIVRTLAHLCRVRWVNREVFDAAFDGNHSVIFAFWHEDLLGTTYTYMLERAHEIAVMVSHSRDGEKLARVYRQIGAVPIRGSSTRGAVGGTMEMIRWLNSQPPPTSPGRRPHPRIAAIALDGPRGPRRIVKPGIALTARRTGATVIPLAYLHTRQHEFGSWDRMRLPIPFCRTTVLVGTPLYASQDAEQDESFAFQLQHALDELHRIPHSPVAESANPRNNS